MIFVVFLLSQPAYEGRREEQGQGPDQTSHHYVGPGVAGGALNYHVTFDGNGHG